LWVKAARSPSKAFKFNEPSPQVPQLFRTWREGSFAYDIPLRNGKYRVRLSFFEPDSKAVAGARKFDVVINGALVDSGLDVFEAAGRAMKAVVRRSACCEAPTSGSNVPPCSRSIRTGREG
jgi:hypothetical protein